MAETLEDLRLEILGIDQVAECRQRFRLERPDGFDFEAGQHIYLETRPDLGTPFTIASSPGDEHLAFVTIMRDASPLKQELARKVVGDSLIVSGPYGDFGLGDEARAGLIAGGIGITPFLSMLEQRAHDGTGPDLVLLYSNKTAMSTVCLERLREIAATRQDVRLVATMTEDPGWDGERGRIDAAFVSRHVADAVQRRWYVAGPPGMVQAMDSALRGLGVTDIELDEFEGY